MRFESSGVGWVGWGQVGRAGVKVGRAGVKVGRAGVKVVYRSFQVAYNGNANAAAVM